MEHLLCRDASTKNLVGRLDAQLVRIKLIVTN
jgi:hypothetical protein